MIRSQPGPERSKIITELSWPYDKDLNRQSHAMTDLTIFEDRFLSLMQRSKSGSGKIHDPNRVLPDHYDRALNDRSMSQIILLKISIQISEDICQSILTQLSKNIYFLKKVL